MKRLLIPILIMLLIVPTFVNAETIYDGILSSKSFSISRTNFGNIHDKDLNTYSTLGFKSNFSITFDEPQNINAYFIKAISPCGVNSTFIRFYDSSDALLLSRDARSNGAYFETMPLLDVKKVMIFQSCSFDLSLYEVEFYELMPRQTPPPVPQGLQVESTDYDRGKVVWQSVNDDQLFGYNVYLNGNKVNNDLIKSTSYEITGLTEDTTYAVQVSAVDIWGNESNKSSSVFMTTTLMPKPPVLTLEKKTFSTITVTWTNKGNQNEVYVDDVLYATVAINKVDITKLSPRTDYRIKVIAIDKYGTRMESNELVVTTESFVLDKTIINVTNITDTSARILWSKVNYADRYKIYLNDNLIDTVTTTSYDLTNLQPSTEYVLKIFSESDDPYDVSESIYRFKTKESPVPTVNSAKFSPIENEPTKRSLIYTHSNGVQSVKVYLNDKFIGEYSVDDPIDIDVTEFSDKLVDLKIEPVPQGIAFTGKALLDGTGTELDQPVGEMFSAFDVIKKGFLYLVLGAIAITVLVILFFWLRAKFKQKIGGEKFIGATVSGFGLDFNEKKKHARLYHNKNNGFGMENHRDEYIPRYRRKKGFRRFENVSFLGSGKRKTDITYEKDGVSYKRRYVRGKEMFYVPRDFDNKMKLMRNNMQNFSKVLGVKRKGK